MPCHHTAGFARPYAPPPLAGRWPAGPGTWTHRCRPPSTTCRSRCWRARNRCGRGLGGGEGTGGGRRAQGRKHVRGAVAHRRGPLASRRRAVESPALPLVPAPISIHASRLHPFLPSPVPSVPPCPAGGGQALSLPAGALLPAHRLDAGTEGLVVLAKTPAVANYFRCRWRAGRSIAVEGTAGGGASECARGGRAGRHAHEEQRAGGGGGGRCVPVPGRWDDDGVAGQLRCCGPVGSSSSSFIEHRKCVCVARGASTSQLVARWAQQPCLQSPIHQPKFLKFFRAACCAFVVPIGPQAADG